VLVLSRRPNEKILFPAQHIAIQIVSIKSGLVRLGIEAPRDVTVLRQEVHDRVAHWGTPEPRADLPGGLRELRHLVSNRLQIAGLGLSAVSRQLEAGQTQEAEATLAKLKEDLRLLQQRLKGDVGEAPRSPAPNAACSRRALLVEDNANERELLARFLRLAGVDVDTASDGSDALDYLRTRGRPDVVLLDMGLPRCDGPTTVRAIRQDPVCSGLKIFAVTGHAREEFALDNGPAGIDRWFQKPIDLAALVVGLNEALEVCHR
jgi:carbon storage regulator CsrA